MENDSTTENPENGVPKSPKEFHLEMPLYREVSIKKENARKIMDLLNFEGTIDVYCVYCEKESVFKNTARPGGYDDDLLDWANSEYSLEKYVRTVYRCQRNQSHEYISYFRIYDWKIIKVGQYPSVADFQIPQIQKYHKLLGEERYKEFSRGVGLFAHGVGIGSFVYLRRVFEGLIKEARDTVPGDFDFDEGARMEDKILALKDFLPAFLVQNRSIYGILSKGIHELSEEECLKYFNSIKIGIELILDERIKEHDRQKKEKKAGQIIGKITGEIKRKK